MVTFKEIDCMKCEQFIKPKDRHCEECSRVYNEHLEKVVKDKLSKFSKDELINKLYKKMTGMEQISMMENGGK